MSEHEKAMTLRLDESTAATVDLMADVLGIPAVQFTRDAISAHLETLPPYAWVDDDGRHVWFSHRCDHGRDVTMLPHPHWQHTNLRPLTVIPSIDCGMCGMHGFITDGQWVRA